MSEPVQAGLWREGPEGAVRLLGSQCDVCGAKAFPARKICSRCCSEKQSAAVLSRRGQIYSFTRVYIQSPDIEEVPYAVGYVLLEDGLTVPARLQGPGEVLQIGTSVVLEIGVTGRDPGGREITGYYFRPEAGEVEK